MATDVATMATNEYARRQKEDNTLPGLVFKAEDVVDLLPEGASFKFVQLPCSLLPPAHCHDSLVL